METLRLIQMGIKENELSANRNEYETKMRGGTRRRKKKLARDSRDLTQLKRRGDGKIDRVTFM